MTDRALDRSLLARSLGRGGRRVKGVVAAQLREPLIPGDDGSIADALALGDRRAEVVVDALARNPAQPIERADVTSKNDSRVMSN
jgi:hypothetical protein